MRTVESDTSESTFRYRGAAIVALLLIAGLAFAIWTTSDHAGSSQTPQDGGDAEEVANSEDSSQGTVEETTPAAGEPHDSPSAAECDVDPLAEACEDQTSVVTLWSTSPSELDDPTADGWDTEVFNKEAGDQLSLLGMYITGEAEIDAAAIEAMAAEDFTSDPLLPQDGEVVFHEGSLRVARWTGDSAAQPSYRGPAGLVEAIRAASQPYADAQSTHYKAKIFRVEPEGDTVTSRQYILAFAQTPNQRLEQNATWEIEWERVAEGPPKIRTIQVVDYEQVSTDSPQPWLAECGEAVLGGNRCYDKQFLHGYEEWLERSQEIRGWNLLGTPGLAIGDVNGDGLEDLYVCQERGLPNRLFLHRPDGTAEDVSQAWGVDWLETARSALLVDLDNDGDQDLVVAVIAAVVIAENVDNERFRIAHVIPTPDDTMSLSAADYDQDGLLDVYVCIYYPFSELSPEASATLLAGASSGIVLHDSNVGGSNMLLHNRSRRDDASGQTEWEFHDVVEEIGLDENNTRFSFASAWEDYDNDGDLDLYVANDLGRDNLYENLLVPTGEARFDDVAEQANVEDSAFGMAVTWGDYNRDGFPDVYISNMWSSAGNRVTFQPEFKADAPEEVRERIQRTARGNTLLANQGDGSFGDVSAAAGVEIGRWAWGSLFCDLNNDGWEDLVVLNGFVTTGDTSDL